MELIPTNGTSIESILRGVLGMIVLLLISYSLSNNKKAIEWKTVFLGLLTQLIIAIGVLKIIWISDSFEFFGSFSSRSWLGKKIDRKQIKRRKREIFLLVLLGYSVQHFNSTTTRFVVNSFLVLVLVIFAAALRARLSLADYSRRRSRPTRRKIFAAEA